MRKWLSRSFSSPSPRVWQITLSIEMLDFDELMIEEVTGPLKTIDGHEQLPHLEPITIVGKFLFIEEQWLVGWKEQR